MPKGTEKPSKKPTFTKFTKKEKAEQLTKPNPKVKPGMKP